jgi:uncharacterized protein (DUF1697 family)
MERYVALLRGVNVGGKNPVRMDALKACLEAEGLRDVTTYIQSGNVLFSAPASGRARLARRIEDVVEATFGCRSSVVLRDREQLRAVVARAPDGFGREPARYRYDVVFLKEPLTAAAAMRSVETRPGVDEAHAGAGVLYFSRLARKAAQSRLSRLVSTPAYRSMTLRNWNTTTKLLELLEREGAAPADGPRRRRTSARR